MRTFFLLVSLLSACCGYTQRPDQAITRDSLMGWNYRNNVLKPRPLKPASAEGRTYSGQQIAWTDSFQKWVQMSFIPRAETFLIVKSPKTMKDAHESPLHTYGTEFYGVASRYYSYLRKMEIGGEGSLSIRLSANQFPGRWIESLSTAEDLVFLSPPQVFPTGGRHRSADDDLRNDTRVHPNVYAYPTWHIDQYDYQIEQTILLTRDNKNPFRPLQLGEYLDRLERHLLKSREPDAAEKLETIRRLRREEPGLLNQTARVPDEENRLDNAAAAFRLMSSEDQGYCLYTLPRSAIAESKKDEPLWIALYLKWSRLDIRQEHRYRSLMDQFNFEWIRRFFFDRASLRSQPYRPLREPLRALPPKQYISERSAAMKEAAADARVIYAEDFSGNADDREPVGWFATSINTSSLMDTCHVATVPGKNKKGIIIRGKNIVVPFMSPPVSGDFSIRFTLQSNRGYDSYPLHFYLTDIRNYTDFIRQNFYMNDFMKYTKGNGLWFNLVPNRANNHDMEYYFFHPGIADQYDRYSRGKKIILDDFDLDQTEARIRLTVKGDELALFVNDREVLREKNQVLPGTVFRTMGWVINGKFRPQDMFYLYDLRIEKE